MISPWTKLTSIMALSILLLPPLASAGPPKVIANPSLKSDAVSVAELRSIFLEERNSLNDGSHVVPVLEKSGPAHEAFVQDFLEQDDDQLQKYYRGLAFTGTGFIPKELTSDAEVIAYVAKTRGAVGYVNSDTDTQGVKTLTILRPDGADRTLLVRTAPVYPDTLQKRAIGGIVRLQLTISPQGTVENVSLLGGNPILGQSAMEAVKNWKYAAGHSRSSMEVTIPFNPSN